MTVMIRVAQGTQPPYYNWYTGENLGTLNGKLPDLSCPQGKYRMHEKPGGIRSEGCIPCPRGTYGDFNRTNLKSIHDCVPCPLGTYRDDTGGVGAESCNLCPKGTYGENPGMTTKTCSGFCTDWNNEVVQYYSNIPGLTTRHNCKVCPYGYAGHQCEHDIGFFLNLQDKNKTLQDATQ